MDKGKHKIIFTLQMFSYKPMQLWELALEKLGIRETLSLWTGAENSTYKKKL